MYMVRYYGIHIESLGRVNTNKNNYVMAVTLSVQEANLKFPT